MKFGRDLMKCDEGNEWKQNMKTQQPVNNCGEKLDEIFNFCLETREKEDSENHHFDAGVGQAKSTDYRRQMDITYRFPAI